VTELTNSTLRCSYPKINYCYHWFQLQSCWQVALKTNWS